MRCIDSGFRLLLCKGETHTMNVVKRIWRTYGLIRKLSALNSSSVSGTLLDRALYNSETLPPLGKEYWWFLFFGQNGERPVQLMLLIFRKYGRKMLFNDREMLLKTLGKNKFQAITAGWVYDGKRFLDLGDTNAVVEIQEKTIFSEISGQRMILSGGFPDYKLRVGDIIDLSIKRSNYLENKDACGVFIPPFGVGWVDIFSDVNGIVFGTKFKGTSHLQKVVGVTIFGPFHWGRIFFKNDSVAQFFCLKTGKNSKTYFHKSLTFFDQENNEIIEFNNPRLRISKSDTLWIVEGEDHDKTFSTILETYAVKHFTMKGEGSQVYVEYAVIPKKFYLKTKDQVITLEDLGGGVGTFEDAYW